MLKTLRARLLALLLALCLLAGCGGAPAAPAEPSESESPSSSSGIEMAPAPAIPGDIAGAPVQPGAAEELLPQEDQEHLGNLGGTQLYYTPGHRLTLYAMEPEAGAIRALREGDFWNGRRLECASPSGNRLLLFSEDGAPTRRVAALSVYDIERDTLVNLERTIEKPYGEWKQGHWFPAQWSYAFVDEDTFYYLLPCWREDPERPHLHRYHIEEDGTVTASFLELDCQGREELGWESECFLFPETGIMMNLFYMGDDSWEWFTWDIDTGKLLSRTPGNNAGSTDYYLDGVFYGVDNREDGTFALTAYHVDTDTLETLGTGVIPKAPGMEEEPIDSRGVLETVWVREVIDGKFLLRSAPTIYPIPMASAVHRDLLWDPAAGGEIAFGEPEDAPTFPAAGGAEDNTFYNVSPEGEGMFLVLPPELAARYQSEGIIGSPYPLAWLPGGELLFLAYPVQEADEAQEQARAVLERLLPCTVTQAEEMEAAMAGGPEKVGDYFTALYQDAMTEECISRLMANRVFTRLASLAQKYRSDIQADDLTLVPRAGAENLYTFSTELKSTQGDRAAAAFGTIRMEKTGEDWKAVSITITIK